MVSPCTVHSDVRSIDSRPASTCCTLGRGGVEADVSVRPVTRVRREIPGPRFGDDSPELCVPRAMAPKNRRQARRGTRQCQRAARTTCCCCEQGVETSTEWADEGSRRGDGTADAGVQKGTDMRRETILHALNTPAASPLISPTASGRTIRTVESGRRSLATIAHIVPRKFGGMEGARLGSPWRQHPPNLSNVVPAGSLTDQTLAATLLPSSPLDHSHAGNSKSPPQAIRWFLHW